jgi:hypothetical protein
MPSKADHTPTSDELLQRHLSPERLSTYLQHCSNDLSAALRLYAWNTEVAGAFWESLGPLLVALRNNIDEQLSRRHQQRGRPGSWLDDPARELTQRARADVAKARSRVRRKKKQVRHGQVLAELSFGFWRFLITRTYQATLWPDVASAFPHAPNRALVTVEHPVDRLYEFRNRLAHHEKVWSQPLHDLHRDLLMVLHHIDPEVSDWVKQSSRIPEVLADHP